MLSFINSSVSKFCPGISSSNDWIEKLGLQFIKVELFSFSRYSSLLSSLSLLREKGSKFDTRFKRVHILRNTCCVMSAHFTWKKFRQMSQFHRHFFCTFHIYTLPIELTVLPFHNVAFTRPTFTTIFNKLICLMVNITTFSMKEVSTRITFNGS